jgi:prepilin-type N-terminal cleavage/methylation domain-containing protein
MMARSGAGPTCGAPARGFTLAEVLTAIAVLSVVLLLVTESYTRTMMLFRRGGEQLRQTQAVIEVLEDLGADLEGAAPEPQGPAPQTGEEDVVLKLRSASPGRRQDLSEGTERFEIVYRLQAEDKRHPTRKKLVREVRRDGDPAILERHGYALEIAELRVESTAPAPTPGPTPVPAAAPIPGPTPGPAATTPAAVEIELRYYVGRSLEGTESVHHLVEALVQRPGEPPK